MVRFLLEAGADQEHKTDEMHTALMEASMDGHVEVARLLLDSGAQVSIIRIMDFKFFDKGGFFLESEIRFFKSRNLQKKYSKKLSWAWNLNFPPITIYCYWQEI